MSQIWGLYTNAGRILRALPALCSVLEVSKAQLVCSVRVSSVIGQQEKTPRPFPHRVNPINIQTLVVLRFRLGDKQCSRFELSQFKIRKATFPLKCIVDILD